MTLDAWTPEQDAEFRRAADATRRDVEIDTVEVFAAVDEPGAGALVGSRDAALIPEGGDVMIYGDGGAGKTTLTIDLGCHLGAGRDWLGITVQRPVVVLIIEAEGPRALLRQKLRRKLASWDGASFDGRLRILTSPWASFTFADAGWRTTLAKIVDEHQVDVIVAGPLTRIGMDSAGTLQEVVAFMALVNDVRGACARRVTVVLVHHENKGGAVSGAWEGAGDTLLHVTAAGPGHTIIHVQKARWSSQHHGQTLKLAWTDGEGFELEGDRNYLAEIEDLYADGAWRTIDETREAIGAGTPAVEQILKTDRFAMRTGEAARALGRHSNARLYQLSASPLSPEWRPVETPPQGVDRDVSTSPLPLKEWRSQGDVDPDRQNSTDPRVETAA